MPFPPSGGPGFPFQSSAKDFHSIPNGYLERLYNQIVKTLQIVMP
jgi:hypothetical protein